MNKNPLIKLLFAHNKTAQLVLAVTGGLLGILVVMSGIQFYLNSTAMLKQKDILGGDFIVLNKPVGVLNTISGTVPGFSEEEMSELQQAKDVEKVAAFSSGSFKASMELSGEIAAMAGPAFKTDLFFEAVPDGFVDIESGKWQWKPGDESVPIIIPSDYIKLYNMAFAQSQGLPVIPESLIKSVRFDLRLKGNGQEEVLKGRIAGFSQRINSILVPPGFLKYGNQKFGNDSPKKPSRIIIHTKNPASPAIVNIAKTKGYEMQDEKVKSGTFNAILQIILGVVLVFGFFITVLAILGFIQYNQLLAYRSAYEIQTLHWLGYSVSQLAVPYIKRTVIITLCMFAASSVFLFVSQIVFANMITAKGFETELPSLGLAVAIGFVISLLVASLSAYSTFLQVKKIALA